MRTAISHTTVSNIKKMEARGEQLTKGGVIL